MKRVMNVYTYILLRILTDGILQKFNNYNNGINNSINIFKTHSKFNKKLVVVVDVNRT